MILPHMASSANVLIRARAIEVIEEYGYLEFSSNAVLQQIVEYLYQALREKGNILINIKAACAFNMVFRHKAALDMVKPYLKELLECYLLMITEHEIENLVASLEGII